MIPAKQLDGKMRERLRMLKIGFINGRTEARPRRHGDHAIENGGLAANPRHPGATRIRRAVADQARRDCVQRPNSSPPRCGQTRTPCTCAPAINLDQLRHAADPADVGLHDVRCKRLSSTPQTPARRDNSCSPPAIGIGQCCRQLRRNRKIIGRQRFLDPVEAERRGSFGEAQREWHIPFHPRIDHQRDARPDTVARAFYG